MFWLDRFAKEIPVDHVSILDTDVTEAVPSVDVIEAAGQMPFAFPAEPTSGARLAPAEFTQATCPHEEPAREPFGAWLLKQRNRGDWIDDLANAARKDPAFPKRGDVEQVRDRLKVLGADGDTYEALDDAELDYLSC